MRSDAADPSFELRAEIDDLEKTPRPSRAARLRELAPRLHARWASGWRAESERESTLRAIAEDLYFLGAVEAAESSRIAGDAARELFALLPSGAAVPRTARFFGAFRDALTAPVLLGAAQRALEETRCALLLRTPDDRFAPVTADGDPILVRFGALLIEARTSALCMCEAIRLLAAAPGAASGFLAERAIAACAAAHRSARSTLRRILLESLELASATGCARDGAFAAWVLEILRWTWDRSTAGAAECQAAREFLRFAR